MMCTVVRSTTRTCLTLYGNTHTCTTLLSTVFKRRMFVWWYVLVCILHTAYNFYYVVPHSCALKEENYTKREVTRLPPLPFAFWTAGSSHSSNCFDSKRRGMLPSCGCSNSIANFNRPSQHLRFHNLWEKKKHE